MSRVPTTTERTLSATFSSRFLLRLMVWKGGPGGPEAGSRSGAGGPACPQRLPRQSAAVRPHQPERHGDRSERGRSRVSGHASEDDEDASRAAGASPQPWPPVISWAARHCSPLRSTANRPSRSSARWVCRSPRWETTSSTRAGVSCCDSSAVGAARTTSRLRPAGAVLRRGQLPYLQGGDEPRHAGLDIDALREYLLANRPGLGRAHHPDRRSELRRDTRPFPKLPSLLTQGRGLRRASAKGNVVMATGARAIDGWTLAWATPSSGSAWPSRWPRRTWWPSQSTERCSHAARACTTDA